MVSNLLCELSQETSYAIVDIFDRAKFSWNHDPLYYGNFPKLSFRGKQILNQKIESVLVDIVLST